MQFDTLYLPLYIFSLVLSLGIITYLWSHRAATGVVACMWYLGGKSLRIMGFVLGFLASDLSGKIFWDTFQWLANVISLLAFPVFITQYAEYKIKNPRAIFLLSLIIPISFTLGLITNGLHHQIYAIPRLTAAAFSELTYRFTALFYGFALYSDLIIFWGLNTLASRLHNLYRAQVAILFLGFIIPLIGSILDHLNIRLATQSHIMPFTESIAIAIIAWGVFRYRIFNEEPAESARSFDAEPAYEPSFDAEPVEHESSFNEEPVEYEPSFDEEPVRHDRLFESMMDPVVILDNQNLVVDINTAMLAILDQKAANVIGKSAKQVFDSCPIPIKQFTQVSYARHEVVFDVSNTSVHYELIVWPLFDIKKKIMGRIYLAHDITAFKELERKLRDLNLDLEDRVRERTHELADAYDITLEGWAKALELRDKETEGHSRRVTETTIQVARVMGIAEDEVEHIRRGAILHDIGKMGVPDHILRKEGALTEDERQIIMKHPQTAYDLLKQIHFLENALDIPYCHHERWDGLGYPRGLRRYEIPLAARIFAVVDVWDALIYDRPYREAWKRENVVQYLIAESGKHFDPWVVNVFLDLVEKGRI